jgi:hypothetical protein
MDAHRSEQKQFAAQHLIISEEKLETLKKLLDVFNTTEWEKYRCTLYVEAGSDLSEVVKRVKENMLESMYALAPWFREHTLEDIERMADLHDKSKDPWVCPMEEGFDILLFYTIDYYVDWSTLLQECSSTVQDFNPEELLINYAIENDCRNEAIDPLQEALDRYNATA